jgi:hypothetical protein
MWIVGRNPSPDISFTKKNFREHQPKSSKNEKSLTTKNFGFPKRQVYSKSFYKILHVSKDLGKNPKTPVITKTKSELSLQ